MKAGQKENSIDPVYFQHTSISFRDFVRCCFLRLNQTCQKKEGGKGKQIIDLKLKIVSPSVAEEVRPKVKKLDLIGGPLETFRPPGKTEIKPQG